MSIKGDIIAVGLGGVVLLAAAWYAKKKIAAAGGAVVDAAAAALPYVNPADEQNVINQAVKGFYQTVTGDTSGTIGTGIYDLTHTGGALENLSWWQMMNPGAAVGSVVGNAVGKQDDWSLGSKLYDWLH